jgi:hypothetical protein
MIIKLEIIEFLLNAVDSEYTIIGDVAERDATQLIMIDFEFRKSYSVTNIIIYFVVCIHVIQARILPGTLLCPSKTRKSASGIDLQLSGVTLTGII